MRILDKVAPIRSLVEFQLIQLAGMLNVDQRLTLQAHQLEDIADEIVTEYPLESIEDIQICFRRGAMGKYGEVYRLDGAVIGQWMKKYLEEKYAAVERKHNNTKTSKGQEAKSMTSDSKRDILALYRAVVGELILADGSNAKENAYQRWKNEWIEKQKTNGNKTENRTAEPVGEAVDKGSPTNSDAGPGEGVHPLPVGQKTDSIDTTE